MQSFWTFFIRKQNFSFLLLGAAVLAGVFSLITIPKESAPEVQIPVAVVTTVLPGGTPLEIEETVTFPIEERIDAGVDNISQITSRTRPGVSTVTVEFEADADIDESIDAVKDEIDVVTAELPAAAEDPTVTDVDFVDQPIMLLSLSSDRPLTELTSIADTVEDELKRVPGVSSVSLAGVRDEAVQVVVDKEALRSFSLSVTDVVRALQEANTSVPVGTIVSDNVSYNVRFDGDFDDPADVENTLITHTQGVPIYVSDVAFISAGLTDPQTYTRLSSDGEPAAQALRVSVFKNRGADVTRVATAVRDRVATLQEELLADADVVFVYDMGEIVRDDLTKLSGTALQTVILVVFILFLMLGWREAVVAGIAIPLSFLIAFIGIEASGNTINFVSLFSLILAVGILVDSAIVITEALHTKLQEGKAYTHAATEAIREFYAPLTAGTLTTVAAFVPLFFLSGVTGKFIASIPATIIFVLLASLLVAIAFIPLIAGPLLRIGDRSRGSLVRMRRRITERITAWYQRQLGMILSSRRRMNRLAVGIVALFVVSLALPAIGAVDTIFFPAEDTDQVFVEVTMPAGTPLARTDLAVRGLEEYLYDQDYIESFITTVGTLSDFGQGTRGAPYATITINRSEAAPEDTDTFISTLLPALEHRVPAGAMVSVFQQSSGPPVGDPVSITLAGDDFVALEQAAERVEDELKAHHGTRNVTSSVRNESFDVVLAVDRDAIARAGITAQTVAQTLRTALEGTTATTIRTGGSERDVMVRVAFNRDWRDSTDTNHASIESLQYLSIQTPAGERLLGSFFESSLSPANRLITHEDLQRVVTVSSDVADGVTPLAVLEEIEHAFAGDALPGGVTMRTGGENEEIDQSFADMGRALILGVLLIILILVFEFNSFRDSFFIISVIPLIVIGVFWGLGITGKPLSFPAIMGFIALAGIVVNNAIILIDTMRAYRHRYATHKQAVIAAATKRLRPIILTSVTTIIGIIPLTYASALWAPLAFSVIFGLLFASILTLLVIPILYYRYGTRAESMSK